MDGDRKKEIAMQGKLASFLGHMLLAARTTSLSQASPLAGREPKDVSQVSDGRSIARNCGKGKKCRAF
jgi:hypothetical protein